MFLEIPRKNVIKIFGNFINFLNSLSQMTRSQCHDNDKYINIETIFHNLVFQPTTLVELLSLTYDWVSCPLVFGNFQKVISFLLESHLILFSEDEYYSILRFHDVVLFADSSSSGIAGSNSNSDSWFRSHLWSEEGWWLAVMWQIRWSSRLLA